MYNYNFGSIQDEKEKFWVISVISNPIRFKSRYALYNKFAQKLKAHNVNHMLVECAYGSRPFELQADTRSVQLKTKNEIWHKENLINIGISRLPSDWKYVAWVDADVSFVRDDVIEETIHQLQHYQVVQMFQNAVDLGPNQEHLAMHQGFVYCYIRNLTPPTPYYTNWHPGFAWAARREAIDSLGGLIDKSILGAGDRHMALSLVGLPNVETKMHPNYHDMVRVWQERAEKNVRRNVGFVPGTLLHYWHGKKKDRRYHDRWQILVNNQFDPYNDLKRDWQGLYQLVDHQDLRSIKLRDQIKAYFRSRHEDSSDLE